MLALIGATLDLVVALALYARRPHGVRPPSWAPCAVAGYVARLRPLAGADAADGAAVAAQATGQSISVSSSLSAAPSPGR